MKRLEMLEKARQLAYKSIDMCSCLSDTEYAEFVERMPEKEAIELLAGGFLQDAIDYNFGK